MSKIVQKHSTLILPLFWLWSATATLPGSASIDNPKQKNDCLSSHYYFQTEILYAKNTCNLATLSVKGDFALESKNYEDAFQFYTKGLSLPGLSSVEQAILYSKRVLASFYMRPLSLQYKNDEKHDLASKRAEIYLSTVYSIALGDAKNCVRLRPDWWTCYYLLGQVYRLQKNYPAAHTAYNQALGLHPGGQFIKNVREASKAQAGGQVGVYKEEAKWKKFAEKVNEEMWKKERDKVIKLVENKVNSPLLETYKKISRNENLKIAALGQVLIGNLYSSGTEGMQINYKIAAAWYKLAAEIENPEALFKLALFHLEGGFGFKPDPEFALTVLEKLANTQPPDAWDEEHYKVQWVDGTSKILTEKSIKWIAKAQSMLGKLFMDGEIVEGDHKEAVKWLQKAIDNRDGRAAHYLGEIYLEGRPPHTDKNLDKAVEYFKLASWWGVTESKFPLAQICLKDFDVDEAEGWFEQAILAGDPVALSRQKEFKTLLQKTRSKLKEIGLRNLDIRTKHEEKKNDEGTLDIPILEEEEEPQSKPEFEKAILKFWAMDSRIRKMAAKPNHTYAKSIVRSMDHLKTGRKVLSELSTIQANHGDEKSRDDLEQKILQELADSLRITIDVFYLSQKELAAVGQILDKIFSTSSQSSVSLDKKIDLNARIVHAFIKRIPDTNELIQFLRMSTLKYPEEKFFHLLLSFKLASLIDIQGSFESSGKGMLLFPQFHDLIFNHIVLLTLLQNQDDRTSKREKREILKNTFTKFLETAPPDHQGVPFMYYSLAELIMREEESERARMDKYAEKWWSRSETEEAIQELRALRQNVTQLFDKGMTAEKMLIPPFLPIQFVGSTKVLIQEYLEDGGQSGKMFSENLDEPWYAHLDDDD